jgi:hypothetical protein
MKITEITVHAGRTFNHPYEQYANFKPGLSLRATITSEDEDVEQATKALQTIAERMAEGQKQQILADLHHLERQARISSSIASTERQIERLQQELATLKQTPQIETTKQEQERCVCGHTPYEHRADGRDDPCGMKGCDCDGYSVLPF